MFARRLASLLLELRHLSITSIAFALVAALLLAEPVFAQQSTIVIGIVTDDVSGKPVFGAEVRILRNGHVIGSGPTDSIGRYSINFETAANLETLSLRVDHSAFVPAQKIFQVRNGQPFNPPDEVGLLTVELADCRSNFKHTVVVGNFLSPIGSQFSSLPERIADALQADLPKKLQANSLPPELQPVFAHCEHARPSNSLFGKRLAVALGADTLIYGYVVTATPPFKISTTISDAYGTFQRPVVVNSENVDLNDPNSATVSADAHAAILIALAAGIAMRQPDHCADVIRILNAIEQFNQSQETQIKALRDRCSGQVENAALLLEP